MNPAHRPMAGNCRVVGAPKTGLDHCPACAAPPPEPVPLSALRVERGRVAATATQQDTTAFGPPIRPEDGVYLHQDMVVQILAQNGSPLADHFKEMRL